MANGNPQSTPKPDKNQDVFHFQRGSEYLRGGEYERAIADLTTAIDLDPKFARAYNARGNAYRKTGKLDKAIADYTKATTLEPTQYIPFYNRGSTYLDNGEYGKAIADFSRATQLEPSLDKILFKRGIAYQDKGEYDKAIADYTKAIELNPNHVIALYNRGGLYFKKGYFDRAIADYDRAIELEPKVKGAANYREWALTEKEQITDIIQCSKIIEENPDNIGAYWARSQVFLERRELEDALTDLNKVIELGKGDEPSILEAYYNRGVTHQLQGNFQKARADFCTVIEILGRYEGVLPEYNWWMKSTKERLKELHEQTKRHVQILLVSGREDSFDNLIITGLKEKAGDKYDFDFVTAFKVSEILNLAQIYDFDMFILYLNNIPFHLDNSPIGSHLDGPLKLVTHLKTTYRRPVVAFSSMADLEEEKVKRAGADFYFLTPFKVEDFLEAMTICLGRLS